MEKNVFISYSWSTLKHEKWVLNLAERLMSDGVNVVLDKWDLKEGQDIYHFMETMVKSDEIYKVLIILDEVYFKKADDRIGGVGTETQIISPKIYNDTTQEKFIPIVVERDSEGKEFIPTYLEGRVYIDLSSIESFEENYEKLLRNIYDRPIYSKPKIGSAPTYLFEEKVSKFKTATMLNSFEYFISKHPERINEFTTDFLDLFYNNLKEFGIDFNSHESSNIGKIIVDNIHEYTSLRNDFLLFVHKLTKMSSSVDFDVFINFLEQLPQLEFSKNRGGYYSYEYENFKFFIHEIILYLVAIGLNNKNYDFVESVLYSTYFFKDEYSQNEPKTFSSLYRNISSINSYYNQTFSKNFHSPMADLIITRLPDFLSNKNIVEADILCFYISDLNNNHWFPITYVYCDHGKFELFYKMQSKKHFESVKMLFNVNTIEEFKNLLDEKKDNDVKANKRYPNYQSSFESVLPLYNIVNSEKIGILR